MGGHVDVVPRADFVRDLVELRRGARGQVQVAAFRRQRTGDGEPMPSIRR